MHDRGVYHFANGDYLEGVWQEAALIICLACAWQCLEHWAREDIMELPISMVQMGLWAEGSFWRSLKRMKKVTVETLWNAMQTKSRKKKYTCIIYIHISYDHMPIYGFLKVDWNQNASKEYTEYTALRCLILIVRLQVYENGVLLKCQDYTFFAACKILLHIPCIHVQVSICSRYFTPKCMFDFATETQTDKRIASCIVTVQNSPATQRTIFSSRRSSARKWIEKLCKSDSPAEKNWCKMMQVFPICREMKCPCFAEAYCSLGISQTCTRLMEERLTLFHCSWGRNLLLNAPNPLLWNQVREHIMSYLGETKRATSACRLLIKMKTSELRKMVVRWMAYFSNNSDRPVFWCSRPRVVVREISMEQRSLLYASPLTCTD